MLTLCIPTLNRYDLLDELITSVSESSLLPEKIEIIDNGGKLDCNDLTNHNNLDIVIHTQIYNTGVSYSWNWFLKNSKFPMLICNDDIKFSRDDLKNFSDANGALLYYTNNIIQLNMFSCFMPTKELIDIIGYFDEMFYPAYYEDCDYAYRMKLAGILPKPIKTEIDHAGSATVRYFSKDRLNQHHQDFRKNTDYYKSKWGGLPGEELYTRPFNK